MIPQFIKKLFRSSVPTAIAFDADAERLPKGSIVLSIFLGIILFTIGQNAIFDLREIPTRPEQLAWVTYGGADYVHPVPVYPVGEKPYVTGEYYSEPEKYVTVEPDWSSYDTAAGVPELFRIANGTYAKLVATERRLNAERVALHLSEVYQTQYMYQYQTGLYDNYLQEDNIIFDTQAIKEQLRAESESIATLTDSVRALTQEYLALSDQFKSEADAVRGAQRNAYTVWEWDDKVYETKAFGVQILFVVPLFLLSYWWYLRSKEMEKRTSVVPFVLMTVSGILFLEVLGVFFYSWLPHDFIRSLIRFFVQSDIGRFLMYYGLMALAVALIGGMIMFLQKKLFSPERVFRRRLSQHQCPHCALPLTLALEHCPGCGNRIRTKCTHCGSLRFVNLSHCPQCGA